MPAGFPPEVELVACDLDGTLLASDLVIRERTVAAIAAARELGIRVAIVTGRMYQSAVRYARAAGLDEPIVCYQGAAVVDPSTGEFLRHEPIPVELAREAIAAVQEAGHGLNAYVDDELYVAEITPEAERYARFQHLELHRVGDLLAWLERPPTKLVSVAEPEEIDALKERMVARFDDRLHISKSLPIFLELSRKGVTKGSGIAFLARLLEVRAGPRGRVRRRGERPRAAPVGRLRDQRRERRSDGARDRRPRLPIGRGRGRGPGARGDRRAPP